MFPVGAKEQGFPVMALVVLPISGKEAFRGFLEKCIRTDTLCRPTEASCRRDVAWTKLEGGGIVFRHTSKLPVLLQQLPQRNVSPGALRIQLEDSPVPPQRVVNLPCGNASSRCRQKRLHVGATRASKQ